MNGSGISWSGRIRYLSQVKSSSLVLYCERDFIRFTAETDIDVFWGILMISVNDRVCESFARSAISTSLSPSAAQPHFLIKSMSLSTKGEIAATSLGKERSSSRQGPP